VTGMSLAAAASGKITLPAATAYQGMPTFMYEVTTRFNRYTCEWCGSRRAPSAVQRRPAYLFRSSIARFRMSLRRVYAPLVCVGMNGFAIFVGFELRLRFLHNSPGSPPYPEWPCRPESSNFATERMIALPSSMVSARRKEASP